MRGVVRPRCRETGQMVVELCVVMPVILMVCIAIVDGLVFAAACAQFDHLAPQAVLAVAGSPSGSEFDAQGSASEIEARLLEEMGEERMDIAIEASEDGRVCSYSCQLSVVPWPLGDAGGKLFGMSIPVRLSRTYTFCIRPYVIGEL